MALRGRIVPYPLLYLLRSLQAPVGIPLAAWRLVPPGHISLLNLQHLDPNWSLLVLPQCIQSFLRVFKMLLLELLLRVLARACTTNLKALDENLLVGPHEVIQTNPKLLLPGSTDLLHLRLPVRGLA